METSRPTLTPQSPLLHLLILFILAAAAGPVVSADKFIVGDKQFWSPDVNYTAWADQYRFHVGDWLAFYYTKGMYDVMEVNATAYEACSAEDPIVNWNRGRSFFYQLNRTGPFYFICSGGYCYHGMRLTVLVEALPPPSPPQSSPQTNAAAAAVPSAAWAAAGAVALAFVLRFLH